MGSAALSVGKKYKQACCEAEESERYYQGLCENLKSTVRTQWEAEMANAQERRMSDIAAMDIFNPAMETGGFFQQAGIQITTYCGTVAAPSCTEKQLELIQEESTSHQLRGSMAWIVEGLAIQESQYAHQYNTERLIEGVNNPDCSLRRRLID